MEDSKNFLKLLIISDIHQNDFYLDKVIAWHSSLQDKLTFDYLLIPGDTGNVVYKNGIQPDPAQQIKSQGITSPYLAKMVSILSKLQYFGCPIYYIPGNHDCLVQYQSKTLTKNSHNIHKLTASLTPTLKIKGFGGSLPGYYNNKQFWDGYPYNSQQQLSADFQCFSSQQQTSQFILMSHVGPRQSTTTIDSAYEEVIITGSETLDKYIEKNRQKLVMNMHGHTHMGTGTTKLRGVTLMNPGSVGKGEFGVVGLRRKEGKWGVEKIEFLNMRYM